MTSPRIVVLVPRERTRQWALVLAEALRERFQGQVELRCDDAPSPAPDLLLERAERWAFGSPLPGHADWASVASVPEASEAELRGSLIINLTERDGDAFIPVVGPGTILTPTFEGEHRTSALLGTLERAELPHLGVTATSSGGRVELLGARLALADRSLFLRALNTVLARAITFLCNATAHLVLGKPLPPVDRAPRPGRAAATGLESLRWLRWSLLPLLARKVGKPVLHEEDWCIAYRPTRPGAAPPDLEPSTFTVLEWDRKAFYADPIVFDRDGSSTIFFEQFDYRTRLGRISYCQLSADGRVTDVGEALSRPYHLSYPFLLDHGGATLMIPETSANGTVELYEAEDFPRRWRLRSVLLDNIRAADVTLHRDEATGLWWMFAAVTEFGSLPYDTLSLFYSESVEGPWRPHAMNPVKFDPSSSRPGGPLIRIDGSLIRPAQDCTAGYGGGLAWCEIRELTPASFEEVVVGRTQPPAGYTGLHTYSRGGRFEVVDYKRRRLRVPWRP